MKTNKIIKTVNFLISIIILTSILPNAITKDNVITIYVDDDGGKDFTNIKDAINHAKYGDNIYVYNGTYNEYITINKSINLIGQNKEKTIIQPINSLYNNYLIKITADNVKISDFKIKNNFNKTPEYSYISYSSNDSVCILIESDNNEINNNHIFKNWGIGILLNNSEDTIISNNTITDHHISSIYLLNSSKNIIINNDIKNNNIGIIFDINSTDNILYHNNFINNTYYHVYSKIANFFYDYTTKQGNYYDDYDGIDKNNDGIGDTPYNISKDELKDLYPLMSPYYGWIVIKDFYIDKDAVIYMLWIAMIVTIIFLIPIAYIWYIKTRPRK